MMDKRTREALDRHITGNYGEDQYGTALECIWCPNDADFIIEAEEDDFETPVCRH